jgi:hypothetical protein
VSACGSGRLTYGAPRLKDEGKSKGIVLLGVEIQLCESCNQTLQGVTKL